MDFSKNGELYEWIRKNWEIDILSKTSMINTIKTAGTRNCYLCMRERIEIFKAFQSEKKQKNKLMNSRTEIFSKCTCPTRFLRLCAVGNEGADEATS